MLFMVNRCKDSCTSVNRLSNALNDYGLTHVMAVQFIDKRAIHYFEEKTKQNKKELYPSVLYFSINSGFWSVLFVL